MKYHRTVNLVPDWVGKSSQVLPALWRNKQEKENFESCSLANSGIRLFINLNLYKQVGSSLNLTLKIYDQTVFEVFFGTLEFDSIIAICRF